MLSKLSPRRRSRSRIRSRGAAMVEAAVVMPVLVTCFGAMMYAGGARYVKLGQQQRAREGSLTYAMSGCDQGGLQERARGLPSLRGQNMDVDPREAADTGDHGTNATLRDAIEATVDPVDVELIAASGAPPPVDWNWNGGGSVAITARSYYLCNERGEDDGMDTFAFARERMGMFLR